MIEEGSVLLKNDAPLLPLDTAKTKSIAAIGSAAGPQAIFGEEGPAVYVEKMSVLSDAIVRRAGSSVKVSYIDLGAGVRPLPILTGNILRPSSGQGQGFTAQYYRSSDLTGTPVLTQNASIEAVANQNPNTVVVLNTSTPVAMPWIGKVKAVLEAWYPGQESDAGTAALLFGDANPGGRVPVTFPVSADQGPATRREEYPGVHGIAHYDEGILVGYRWYDQRKENPLFPFGFGLSYTTFRLSGLEAHRSGDSIQVSLTATNTGTRKGSEVIQVYVEEPADAQEPPSQLRGFAKAVLQPGEHRALSIEIPVKSLAAWDEKRHDWHLWPGDYRIKAGESSRNLTLEVPISLAGD